MLQTPLSTNRPNSLFITGEELWCARCCGFEDPIKADSHSQLSVQAVLMALSFFSFKIAPRGVACSTLPCFSGGESSQKFKNVSAKPSPEARAKFHLLWPGLRSAERPGLHITITQRRALRLKTWLGSQRVSQCLSHRSFDFYPFFFFFFLIRGLCSRACPCLTLSVMQLVENKPVWCNHRRSRAFSTEKQNPQEKVCSEHLALPSK